jgi:hypothetical protein
MRSNVRAIVATAFIVAAVGAVAPQTAFAAVSAHPGSAKVATHKWHFWGYKGIQVYGTWSKSSRGGRVAGYMHDARKDGKWVRVIVAAADAKGRPGSEGIFAFNGGRRVYTSTKYVFSQDPTPPHMIVQTCLLSKPGGKPTGCGHWHRVF